ncbi:5'-nucleotidase, lipoprotein e(P4) family [Yeosuana sp.]|uniref:5'-nucleotidase, lipoprotein e(P4) family n=1 Tax=Yeosuana sp. TaxID=2529388 RepID=UPI004054E7DE|tara:strand:- start:498 stop:1355 length:858 start_codon:yes stop_codon:yes gene_type:complete
MNNNLNFQPVNIKVICVVLSLVVFLGCGTNSSTYSKQDKPNLSSQNNSQEHMVQAVLWQQRSAEYKALCYQAFNVAKLQIDHMLSKNLPTEKPLAIITDIDETILNNSPYNAKLIEQKEGFSQKTWADWENLEDAKAIPGALEFLNYAESKGIQIYYVSNRLTIQEDKTMNNLKKIGFPFIDKSHFLLKDKTSGKEERRQLVMKNNTVIMLLGDNLADFNDLFDNKTMSERDKTVDELSNKFGAEYIVLPNPMYGDWETDGIYEGKYNWNPTQKDSIRKAKLISY